MRCLIEFRFVLSLAASAIAGVSGLHAWPFPIHNPILGLIALERPAVYAGFTYVYAVLWFSSPFFVSTMGFSMLSIFGLRSHWATVSQPLPPYPEVAAREDLFLVLGEQHHRTTPKPAATPTWLTIPERGLYTGTVIVGAIGTGKTSACMYPYVEQLLGYQAGSPKRKVGGLVLEVKGDFCEHVREILKSHGREGDYIEVSLDSQYRYNPLHNDLDAYALAYGIATLMTNLFGRSEEPFWQQASTNLVKFVILLHQTLDRYVTLNQIYEHVISPDKLRAKIMEGDRQFAAANRRLVVTKEAYLKAAAPKPWTWQVVESRREMWSHWSSDLEDALKTADIAYRTEEHAPAPDQADRVAQFESVKRWFQDDWMRIEPKLRTSIVEGVSVFLSLFDDNPRVKYTFCPPKATYEAVGEGTSEHGIPLPPMADLIEQGKVVALNFPIAMNPGLARALGTMLKQDFQRAVLNRIHKMNTDPNASQRPMLFVCDEYQAFATTGENEPSGDEKFFSLARQAKCIPIVATQSISSLRSTLPGESWRTLLQGLRTKIFLALSDDFSAHMAADLCGKTERLKSSYSITESGQDARVSMLTGRPAAHRSTVTAAKSYRPQLEYVFEPKVFAQLQNAQAIVLPYDGLNPHPPTYCYLKPHYLPVQTSYFEHARKGVL